MRYWIIEDDGTITSAAYPDLALTSMSRRSKADKTHGVDLMPKDNWAPQLQQREEGNKKKQDATFDFYITLETGEVSCFARVFVVVCGVCVCVRVRM